VAFLMAACAIAIGGVSLMALADRFWAPAGTSLPDQKLDDLFSGPSATTWRHGYACTECSSPVGHQEFMTKICLTCGRRMRWLPRGVAIRKVVRRGRWVRQQMDGDSTFLELKDGAWLTPEKYDQAMGTA
jgi:hypothetical protein